MKGEITVRETWGSVLVERSQDDIGITDRWWFYETDGSSLLVLSAHVREYERDQHDAPVAGRHYTARQSLDAPAMVRDALTDAGYDGGSLYVLRGRYGESVEEL